MDSIAKFLDMGGYAGFVWPAYGIAVAVLGVLIVISLRQLRAREREAAAIEPLRGGRAQVDAAKEESPCEA